MQEVPEELEKDKSDDKKPTITVGKPLQTLSYAAKDSEWRKQNVEYFIRTAATNLNAVGFAQPAQYLVNEVGTMADWYDFYNNRIDDSLFNYVTNPLNTENELYKKFPAKIRNYNILRPTIDLLIGEWCKRPFKFDVLNLDGEGTLNSFLEAKTAEFKKNITQRMVAEIQSQTGQPVDPKEIPDPATVIDNFNGSYKDIVATNGYKALKLLIHDLNLKESLKDEFKDFLIAGMVGNLKQVKRSLIERDRISPKWLSTNKAPQTKNFEDASDTVVKFRITVADLVDLFYEELKEEHLIKLEQDEDTYRRGLFNFFNVHGNQDEGIAKIDLFYTCWKSRKKIGFLTYRDPITGETLTTEVDESYKPDTANGETVEWVWTNEAWHGWRVNDNLYLGIEPVPIQRNEMNNFSSCKLPVNGRRFSDTESINVSVLSLGIPYQIMYIIMNYRIELTIAKSKGKIQLLDKNSLSSDGEEHGDEKTFYYAEALGYMLIDRNQDGVDRSWNQYQTLDMSLFQHIEQMIKLAQWYKDQWEELMGITRQRKGANNSTDGLGVTQEAIFRSSIISEIIFSTFDEYVQSELQGLLDLSKFAWIDGKEGYYRNDDGRMEFFKIDPDSYCTANMGVYVDIDSQLAPKMELLKGQINAVAQRKDVKISTIADLIFTDSYTELREKLKKAEAIEQQIIEQTAENEHERQKELEQMKKDYAAFENMLELQRQEREWDRKDNNEYIKGELQIKAANNPSNETVDVAGIEQAANDRLDRLAKLATERYNINSKERIEKMKDETKQKDIAAKLKIANDKPKSTK